MTTSRTRTDIFAADVRYGRTTPEQRARAARVIAGQCVATRGSLAELSDALEALGIKPYESKPTLHRGRPRKDPTP